METKEQTQWNVDLVPSRLKDHAPIDFIAELVPGGATVNNKQLAARIKKLLPEVPEAIILGVLEAKDIATRGALKEGRAVQDGVVRLAPKVGGKWKGSNPEFIRDEHDLTLICTLAPEMKADLKDHWVAVRGMKDAAAFIGLLTDLSTGSEGNKVTPDGEMVASGIRIRVWPLTGGGLGLFFTDSQGVDWPVTHMLIENNPKRLVFRVPADLPPGEGYTFKVVTRYTKGDTLLDAPRTIVYPVPLTVVAPVPPPVADGSGTE